MGSLEDQTAVLMFYSTVINALLSSLSRIEGRGVRQSHRKKNLCIFSHYFYNFEEKLFDLNVYFIRKSHIHKEKNRGGGGIWGGGIFF